MIKIHNQSGTSFLDIMKKRACTINVHVCVCIMANYLVFFVFRLSICKRQFVYIKKPGPNVLPQKIMLSKSKSNKSILNILTYIFFNVFALVCNKTTHNFFKWFRIIICTLPQMGVFNKAWNCVRLMVVWFHEKLICVKLHIH